MVGLIASNDELRFGSDAHRPEMSSNWPASTNGPMRLPGYHAVTSGASADRKFRIAVLCASRSLMLSLTVMSGLAASKSATTFSNAALGPGFGSSKIMTSSPALAEPASTMAAIAKDARARFMLSSQQSLLKHLQQERCFVITGTVDQQVAGSTIYFGEKRNFQRPSWSEPAR